MVFFIILVLFVASLGRSLGLHDNYARFLLKVFEFCQKKIEKAEKRELAGSNGVEEGCTLNTNGCANSVISRKKSVYGPDPNPEGNQLIEETKPITDQKEFKLDDIFGFIKKWC